MPRPRNEELKEQIQRAAWKLFRAHGYDATTYSLIAKECGISRNLVQYHFPKKQLLAIGLMERLLVEAQRALRIEEDGVEGNFAGIFEIGVCYFEFLLQSEGFREFLADVIRSRDLTEEVLSFNADWALTHAGMAVDSAAQKRALRSVIVQMGGFYSLMYHCLQEGEPFETSPELRVVMEAFLGALGYSPARIARALPSKAASPQRIRPAVKKINAVLL